MKEPERAAQRKACRVSVAGVGVDSGAQVDIAVDKVAITQLRHFTSTNPGVFFSIVFVSPVFPTIAE